MQIDLTGQVVLVTGGARGIGAAITRAFLAEGCTVVICGRTQPEDADLPAVGDAKARFVSCDVRIDSQVAAMIEGIVAEHGRLDIVVNNAGGAPSVLAADTPPRLAGSLINLNLLAPFLVAQAAQKVMAEQEQGGQIINIGSVSSMRPAPGTAIYAATKAGLSMLTRALALEWGPKVRVNQIRVGLVGTELSEMHYGGAEGMAAVNKLIPAGRMAVPEDIGKACVALANPELGYMSGAEVNLDGGGEVPGWYDAVQRNL
ncbi:MAG: SDR family oxidoreductase [Propionibacterium sp.]|nr:SDR family oxidoreductase [Propionibacterium sp.]